MTEPDLQPSSTTDRPGPALRATAAVTRAAASLARVAGRGGSVLGGHVALRLDADVLAKLAQGRRIVTVSATNGKTTTNGLLTAALATAGPVLSNATGSNLATGLITTLATNLDVEQVALEVDEATLCVTAQALAPETMVLGNLSRDQLDRHGAVRNIAGRWRSMLADLAAAAVHPHVVANADDPMVVWSVGDHTPVTWVAIPSTWDADAQVCPACNGVIEHAGHDWRCSGCGLERPVPTVRLVGDTVILDDENARRVDLDIELPGAFNRANAALALTAARTQGIDADLAAAAMHHTPGVGGRYETIDVDGRRVRVLMAKNPAGWQATLDILAPPPTPVVLAVNARVGDGRDPSWLWDVPLEVLAGRRVVAAGERAHDVAVRLHYAGVPCEVVPGPALEAVGVLPPGEVDLVANYTAFADTLAAR